MSRAQLLFSLRIVMWRKLLGLLLCPRASNFPLRAHRASSLYSHWVYSRVMAIALHPQTTLVHTSAEDIEAFVPTVLVFSLKERTYCRALLDIVSHIL